VPQAWHSPQRPDHLVVRHPHSAHWNAGPAEDFAMARTLPAGTDSGGRRHSRAATLLRPLR
jgi:hypothetical protein